ncbi:MAG TPA: methyltransferase [Beijerinckiaceae bacterium]|jgi:tRNA1(Val) A37 N6-methylase TrmN6|nr:methyltransferase [Beijerinckiaceae bacterium]
MDEACRTTDAFLRGALRLQQPAAGNRAGTDAILLAAAVPAKAGGLAIDAGAGIGAAGLAAACAAPALRIALLEREPGLIALARANIAANELEHRVFVAKADLLSSESWRAAGLEREAADLVLTNPPFLSAATARVSPDRDKASAHVIGAGGLEAWISACLALLKPRGTFLIIHRADALAEILQALSQRAGAFIVLPVHPRNDRPATRILVRALKGRRTPLALAPPLVLHNSDGTFTPSAEALHRGEARVDWDELSGP